jgi:hypothetical protein
MPYVAVAWKVWLFYRLYICTSISGVSGIIAIIKTYRHADEVGYTIEKVLFK